MALVQSISAAFPFPTLTRRSTERVITESEYRSPLPDARYCHRPRGLHDSNCSVDVDKASCRLSELYDCNSFYVSLSGPADRNSVENVGRYCKPNHTSVALSTTTLDSKHLCEYDVVCKMKSNIIPSTYWEATLRKNGDRDCKIAASASGSRGYCRKIQHELHVLENQGCDGRVGQQRYRPGSLLVTVAFACTSNVYE